MCPQALLAAVEDELARALEGATRLVASAADLGIGEELRHDVCLPFSTAQWQGRMLVQRGSNAEETRRPFSAPCSSRWAVGGIGLEFRGVARRVIDDCDDSGPRHWSTVDPRGNRCLQTTVWGGSTNGETNT